MPNRRCLQNHSVGVQPKFGSVLSTVALVVALASAAPGLAEASWEGKSLQWLYYYSGGPYGFPVTCTVRRNNVCGNFAHYFNIITRSGSIIFDYSAATKSGRWSNSVLSLPPTIYNGIAINLTSPGTIKSVKIDPSTNMAGFGKSRLSFTANQIQVDWANLPFTKDTIVKLDVRLLKGTEADARMANPGLLTPMAAGYTGPVHAPDPSLNPPIR